MSRSIGFSGLSQRAICVGRGAREPTVSSGRLGLTSEKAAHGKCPPHDRGCMPAQGNGKRMAAGDGTGGFSFRKYQQASARAITKSSCCCSPRGRKETRAVGRISASNDANSSSSVRA